MTPRLLLALSVVLYSAPVFSRTPQPEPIPEPKRIKIKTTAFAAIGRSIEVEIVNAVCKTKLDYNNVTEAELNAHGDVCAKEFIPPAATASTPGLLFIGGAFGSKSNKFLLAPAVSVGAGGMIPLRRPTVAYRPSSDQKVEFVLPKSMSFQLNFIVSANVSVAGLLFPTETTATGKSTTELGYTVGLYSGFEFAGVSYNPQTAQLKFKISFILGVVAAFLGNSDTVGNAFALGVQPGLVINFLP